jgi:hypothetical protein
MGNANAPTAAARRRASSMGRVYEEFLVIGY